MSTIAHRTRPAPAARRGFTGWVLAAYRNHVAWASAATWDDLGERVVMWLNGELDRNPVHGGPPAPETYALIPVLAAANRAGFVTSGSQAAAADDRGCWEASVEGFATAAVLARLLAAVEGTGLVLDACTVRCGSVKHGHGRPGWKCPGREVTAWWAAACHGMSRELRHCWHVTITDPQPGRPGLLWWVLSGFASTQKAITR